MKSCLAACDSSEKLQVAALQYDVIPALPIAIELTTSRDDP